MTVLEVQWRDMERLSMASFVAVWTAFNERYACYFMERDDLPKLHSDLSAWEQQSRETVCDHTQMYRQKLEHGECTAGQGSMVYIHATEQEERLRWLAETEAEAKADSQRSAREAEAENLDGGGETRGKGQNGSVKEKTEGDHWDVEELKRKLEVGPAPDPTVHVMAHPPRSHAVAHSPTHTQSLIAHASRTPPTHNTPGVLFDPRQVETRGQGSH